MNRNYRFPVLAAFFAAIAASGVLGYHRGNLSASEVYMSYEMNLQLKLQECSRSHDSACFERELGNFRRETDAMVSSLKGRFVSTRMQEMISKYEAERVNTEVLDVPQNL